MKFHLTLLSVLLATSVQAFAQSSESSCKDIDVGDYNPALKEYFSTPRDQGQTGWCYAFAAADLLTAETGKKISSAHVSAIYNKSVTDNLFLKAGYNVLNIFKKTQLNDVYEGGFVRKALTDAKKSRSVCTEEAMPFERYINLIEELDELQRRVTTNKDADIQAKAINRLTMIIRFYQIKAASPDEIFEDMKRENLNVIVEKLLTNNCSDKVDLPDFEVKSVLKLVNTRSLFMKNLNGILDMGKPIGIEYKVNMISDQNGNHASVITGRRWNNGKCEYKVRNSWGRSCSNYLEGIKCNYREGSYWVPEETFYSMLHAFNYIL